MKLAQRLGALLRLDSPDTLFELGDPLTQTSHDAGHAIAKKQQGDHGNDDQLITTGET